MTDDAALLARIEQLLDGERQRLARKGQSLPPLVESALLLASSRQGPPKLLRGNGFGDNGRMELLTFDEVAAALKTSHRTVERLAKDGSLPVVRLTPKQPRVRPEDLEAFRVGLPPDDRQRIDGGAGAGGPVSKGSAAAARGATGAPAPLATRETT